MANVSLFSQILSLLPREPFKKLVTKHQSDKSSKGIDSWTHLISMLFCHFAHACSVRDISNGLRSSTGNLSHLGVKNAPSKSSISYINSHRKWELFRDYYIELLNHFQGEYSFMRTSLKQLKKKIYLMDATVIPLCMSLFDWAKFRSTKGAVKLHLVLDYDGCLPVYANITNGAVHEGSVAKGIKFPPGSILVFDRGYIDYKWLNVLDSTNSYFVTRAKDNMAYKVEKNLWKGKKNRDIVLEDSIITLTNYYAYKDYPGKLRLVRIWDSTNKKELVFITNNLQWKAETIADIYKQRWQIEIFFKCIKQYLKIKSFIGTTENAVQIQLWSALICILVLLVLKAKAAYKWHLSNLAALIRIHLFAKIPLFSWLNHPFLEKKEVNSFQLDLFSG